MFTRRFVRIRVVAIAPFGFLFMCMRSCWCVRACVREWNCVCAFELRGLTGTSRRRIGPRREGVACLPSVPQAGVWIAGVVLRGGGRRCTVVLARRRQTDPAVATPRRNERTDPSAHGYTRHGVLPSNRTRAPRRTAARKNQTQGRTSARASLADSGAAPRGWVAVSKRSEAIGCYPATSVVLSEGTRSVRDDGCARSSRHTRKTKRTTRTERTPIIVAIGTNERTTGISWFGLLSASAMYHSSIVLN